MAEPLSPKHARLRSPLANRLQSPSSPSFFLVSNNDQLERAQARAARTAASRRRFTMTADLRPPSPPPDPFLSKEEIIDLLQNCIKLASENKINQKNTWELKLIDHLSEIVKAESENNKETNFEKASCTLEASMKIYSMRVDSLHSEAYKVLSGICRVGLEDEQGTEAFTDNDNVNSRQARSQSKQESEKKILPLATLESSFEALNVKRFDVDPPCHRIYAQVDEGGAKGLLLNNLGVYGGCQILLDSLEVPGMCRVFLEQNDISPLIDLSFSKESIEEMVMNVSKKGEICPTLGEIICLLDKDNQCSRQTFNVVRNSDNSFHDNEVDQDNSFENHGAWLFGHEDETMNENISSGDPTFQGHQENEFCNSYEPEMNDRFEQVSMFLLQRLGFTTTKSTWAGPEYWKYQSPKGTEGTPTGESRTKSSSKRSKKKKETEVDLEFTAFIGKEMTDIFAPPRNSKSLLLSVNRSRCSNSLPEDFHYELEDLFKLFLLANVQCFGKQHKEFAGSNTREQNNYFDEAVLSWDNESVHVCHDAEDSDGLVSRPLRVNLAAVHHQKTSKQVDINVLKGTLWDQMQEVVSSHEIDSEGSISFKRLLATFPVDSGLDAAPEDLSPHVLFICLLHLASERGLIIPDNPSLDDLSICLPSCEAITVL